MNRYMLACLATATISAAAQPATSSDRIITITYSSAQVVPLSLAPDFATVIELGEDERAETIVVGSSSGWQVSANKRGDHVVVKPQEGAAPTNLVITSDTRRYVFLLTPAIDTSRVPFVVHFVYSKAATETALATDYHFRGDASLFPTAMNDDGQRTRIVWDRLIRLPAIYKVDEQGREALVNGRMEGDTFVIQGIAPSYAFRLGKLSAIAGRNASSAR